MLEMKSNFIFRAGGTTRTFAEPEFGDGIIRIQAEVQVIVPPSTVMISPFI
jgi:hypothetical protein